MKEIMGIGILWQGNQIRSMKSACTLSCKLCMVERKEIAKRWRTDKKSLINDRSEMFGSCKCKTRFHRFILDDNAGTDDEFNSERDDTSINSNISESGNTADNIGGKRASLPFEVGINIPTYDWNIRLPIENLAAHFGSEAIDAVEHWEELVV